VFAKDARHIAKTVIANAAAAVITPEQAVIGLWHRGVLAYKLKEHQYDLYSFIAEPPGKKAVCAVARQFGKSFVALLVAVETCLRKKNARVSVVAPTAKMLRGILLPNMSKLLLDCPSELKPRFSSIDNCYTFPNGSTLRLDGADSGNADSLRGRANDLVIIDEAAFVSELRALIYDIVLPSFLTTDGRLVVVSTPPKTPGHFFVELAREAELAGSYLRRTIQDNSSVTPAQRARWAEEVGGETSTAWRREYEVEFVVDEDSAVVPEFSDALVAPTKPAEFEHRLVSMDVGFSPDPTAVLFGYYDFRRACLVIQDELLIRRMRTDVLADQLRQTEKDLWSHVEPYSRVSDVDLIVLNDLSSIHGIHFAPTSKDLKEAMVNELRMWAKSGRIQVDPRCVNLIHQLKTAIWASNRRVFDRTDSGGHFDLVDALIYMVRNAPTTSNPYPQNVGVSHHTHFIDSDSPEETDGLSGLITTRFQ
jgi:hypothetical protein